MSRLLTREICNTIYRGRCRERVDSLSETVQWYYWVFKVNSIKIGLSRLFRYVNYVEMLHAISFAISCRWGDTLNCMGFLVLATILIWKSHRSKIIGEGVWGSGYYWRVRCEEGEVGREIRGWRGTIWVKLSETVLCNRDVEQVRGLCNIVTRVNRYCRQNVNTTNREFTAARDHRMRTSPRPFIA